MENKKFHRHETEAATGGVLRNLETDDLVVAAGKQTFVKTPRLSGVFWADQLINISIYMPTQFLYSTDL